MAEKWTEEEIAEFQRFHEKAKARLTRGESDAIVYADKPEGYTKWAKEHFKETGGVKLKKVENVPIKKCWNCETEYPDNWHKCPKCKKFNPNANKYK